MTDWQTRHAQRNELPAVLEVWEQMMALHAERDPRFALASDAAMEWKRMAIDLMHREDGFVLVCGTHGEPIGFCLGWVAKNPSIYALRDVGFISELGVHNAYKRRGVGRALAMGAAQWFRNNGLTEFQLSTAVWNDGAIGFWEAIGGEAALVRYRFDVDHHKLRSGV